MSDNTIYLNSQNFEAEVLKSELPVVVDFWATWCPPCRAIAPLIDELANESAGKVKVCKLDTDAANDIAARYRVSSIPTIISFKDGKEVERVIGANAKAIRAMVEAHL